MVRHVDLKQPRELTPKKPTEDTIIEWVIKYGVSYGGKAYLSEDTRDLVVMICKDNGIEVEE